MISTTAPRASDTSHLHYVPHSLKVPRERLTRLDVDAGICPQVLLRVLGLISQQGLIPLTVSTERKRRYQRFMIELDDLSEHGAAVLVKKIESIVMVRSANLVRPHWRASPAHPTD